MNQSLDYPALLGLRLAKSAVLIFLAGVLLYRRQRDPVAALLSLAFLTWTITSSFGFRTLTVLPQLVDRGRFLSFALALLLFPEGKWQPSWTAIVAIASCGVFGVGVAECLGLLPTKIFLPLAVSCVVAAVASLIWRFRSTTSYALRQQLKWVALGLVLGIGLILGARTGTALSPQPHRAAMLIVWEAMFQLGIIVIALGFLVSLLRYRLYDAETVITRSAAYAALTVALVATFGGTEGAIENVGQAYLGMNVGGISGAMAAAVAALMLTPLHHRIRAWAEDRFQPDLAQLKRQIPEVLVSLSAHSTPRQLGEAILPHINAGIHSTRSALLLEGQIVAASGVTLAVARNWARNQPQLRGADGERDEADLVFPLRLRLGAAPSRSSICILLGPRPDGTLYGREDLEAVRSIFPMIESALTSALAHHAVGTAISRRERRLRTEISDLRVRLFAIELSLRTRARGAIANGAAERSAPDNCTPMAQPEKNQGRASLRHNALSAQGGEGRDAGPL